MNLIFDDFLAKEFEYDPLDEAQKLTSDKEASADLGLILAISHNK